MNRLKLDRRPLYMRVRDELSILLREGTYQPGEQLPSEANLAAELGISRSTLRQALRLLEEEGVIVRRHGVGTFIAYSYGPPLESGLERLGSIWSLAAERGMLPSVRDLEVKECPADEELGETLQLVPGTPVTVVTRTIVVDGQPLAFMYDVAPVSILRSSDIDQAFYGSVLDLLIKRDSPRIKHARAEITALGADEYLARKFDIEQGRALLLLEETLFSDELVPVEFSRNYFIPEFFRFHVIRRLPR